MSDRLWLRLGAACGIVYTMLLIVGNEVLGPGDSAPAIFAARPEIAAWVANTPQTGLHRIGGYLELLALLLFVFFLGSLWSVLRRAESDSGWLATVAFAGGLLSIAIKIASLPAALAAFGRAGEGFDPQLIAALIDMNNIAFVLTWATNALLLGATAIVVIRTSALPRWLGWSAALIALGLLVAVTMPAADGAFFPMLLFLLWVPATGVALIRRAGVVHPAGQSVSVAPASTPS
jgi:hypothetical protein